MEAPCGRKTENRSLSALRSEIEAGTGRSDGNRGDRFAGGGPDVSDGPDQSYEDTERVPTRTPDKKSRQDDNRRDQDEQFEVRTEDPREKDVRERYGCAQESDGHLCWRSAEPSNRSAREIHVRKLPRVGVADRSRSSKRPTEVGCPRPLIREPRSHTRNGTAPNRRFGKHTSVNVGLLTIQGCCASPAEIEAACSGPFGRRPAPTTRVTAWRIRRLSPQEVAALEERPTESGLRTDGAGIKRGPSEVDLF